MSARFDVHPFATKRFGEKSTYGWRVFDRQHPGRPILAVYEWEIDAQQVADLLNDGAFDYEDPS